MQEGMEVIDDLFNTLESATDNMDVQIVIEVVVLNLVIGKHAKDSASIHRIVEIYCKCTTKMALDLLVDLDNLRLFMKNIFLKHISTFLLRPYIVLNIMTHESVKNSRI